MVYRRRVLIEKGVAEKNNPEINLRIVCICYSKKKSSFFLFFFFFFWIFLGDLEGENSFVIIPKTTTVEPAAMPIFSGLY